MASTNNKLKLGACVMILIGGMFGSAIFSLSGLTIANAGPASLISWFAAAPIMLLYGLLMAEMACYYPKSGGVYVFPAKAFRGSKGKFLAWLSCWSYIIGNFAAIAFSAIYVGVYLGAAFPGLANFQTPIAIASLLFVLVLNIIKVKRTGQINNIMVTALIILMILFVGVTISNSSFDVKNFVPFFGQGQAGTFGFVSMIPIALMSYSAIVAVAFMANEVENPKKTIPRASFISIIVLAILYCLILFATLGIVTADYLSSNPEIEMIPLFAACAKMAGTPWLTYIISIASVIALITTILVVVSLNAWAIQASAEDGVLPRAFAHKSKFGQPIIGLIITVVISAIICLFPNFVNEIVNLGVLFNIITIFIVVIALMFARKRDKLPKDAFRVKGGAFWPVLFLLVIVLCNISNILTSNLYLILIYTGVLLLIGIIIYWISSRK